MKKLIIVLIIIFIILLLFVLLKEDVETYSDFVHEIKSAKSTYNHKKLADLYYKYARKHEENPAQIRAYEPNINIVSNCILSYKSAHKYGHVEAAFDIGRIYQYGIENRGQNPDKAYKYYKYSYGLSTTSEFIKDRIIDNIIILSNESGNDRYINGMMNIVDNTAHRATLMDNVIGGNNVEDTPIDLNFTIGGVQINTMDNYWPADTDLTEPLIGNLLNLPGIIMDFRLPPALDNQNVHDTNYGNIMKENIGYMHASTDINTLYDAVSMAIFESDNTEVIKANAIRVLDTVFSKNTHLAKYDKSEVEILNMVWTRINELDTVKRKAGTDMLVLQLSEAYEGYVVCATGRAMHILCTLDGIDDNFKSGVTKSINNIVIKEKLHTELLESAAKLTKDSTLEGKQLQEYVYAELYKKYVDSKIMSEADFKADVDIWIDYI